MYTPHNFFEAPKDEATPTPQPHQDEAAELARADRSPAAAFIGLALALTSLAVAGRKELTDHCEPRATGIG